MPFVGLAVVKLFNFPAEIAACILLIGCTHSGLASNAFEVGMQNGGLTSGLALQMGKLAIVGLAAAIFCHLINITGSSLATWW